MIYFLSSHVLNHKSHLFKVALTINHHIHSCSHLEYCCRHQDIPLIFLECNCKVDVIPGIRVSEHRSLLSNPKHRKQCHSLVTVCCHEIEETDSSTKSNEVCISQHVIHLTRTQSDSFTLNLIE